MNKIAAGFASLAGLLGFAPQLCAQGKTPNILYIFTDQQTATAMSCAGNTDLATPNMDKLASEGVRFTNAYCAAPLSTPSRGAMFTGSWPHQSGIDKNGLPVPENMKQKTLGQLLSGKGYECVYAGKWHLPASTIDPAHGFRKIHDFGDIGLAESCVSYLKQKHDSPFFLVASFDNPHNICEYARKQSLPWAVVNEPASITDCPNLPSNYQIPAYEPDIIRIEKNKNFKVYPTVLYNQDDWRRYRNAYYRLVEEVDMQIGKIMKALTLNGLDKNTIIIFSSDHGDGNGAHQWNQKSVLYEEVVNIPLIVRLPDYKNAETVSEELVSNGPDFFASVCDWAGINVPDDCQGKSLREIVEGRSKTNHRDYVVTQTIFDGSDTHGWMIRTEKYKYILYQLGRNREQLFDMQSDRGEMVNLAVEKKHAGILNNHKSLLKEWAIQTNNSDALKAIPEMEKSDTKLE